VKRAPARPTHAVSAQLEAEVYAYTAQLPRFAAFSGALPGKATVFGESIG